MKKNKILLLLILTIITACGKLKPEKVNENYAKKNLPSN